MGNLLANAVRATRMDGSIRVRTHATTDTAELHVEDDGAGIPAGMHERIFEPFIQGLDRSTDARPGTGVGLTLVREYVELHGGSVAAFDRPGGGARYEVSLPLVEP